MKPNLIIQMQRIGDLILTFPLAQKMLEIEPERPLWIVAEPHFYNALLPLAPKVVFIPPDGYVLKTTEFNTVINLSHRSESAHLTSSLKSDNILGHYIENNMLNVKGFWQLYRTSLTHNSRHNLFHWADLNALDILSFTDMKSMKFPFPKKIENKGKIGLFLGASSAFKRPEPEFFVKIANKLFHLGYKPVFLGGKAEKELGEYINKNTNLHTFNLVDKFTLKELVFFMQELDLLITPDTGPMHIAAAFSVPTLTLSMGNVNPYETSVASPNHFVLQANMSCTSCWDCRRNFECKQKFTPSKIALFAQKILEGKDIPSIPNISLYKIKRDQGLHKLERISSTKTNSKNVKELFNLFWQEYFLKISPNDFPSRFSHLTFLEENLPEFLLLIQKAQLQLSKEITSSIKTKKTIAKDFWIKHPPFMRQLTSFIQLYLENDFYSKESYLDVFNFIEEITSN